MDEPSSRRDFVKTLSTLGVAAVAGGVVGYAVKGTKSEAPSPARGLGVRVDESGFIVVEDPELIAVIDSVFQDQEKAVREGRATERGLRLKYVVNSQMGKVVPINLLCVPGCYDVAPKPPVDSTAVTR